MSSPFLTDPDLLKCRISWASHLDKNIYFGLNIARTTLPSLSIYAFGDHWRSAPQGDARRTYQFILTFGRNLNFVQAAPTSPNPQNYTFPHRLTAPILLPDSTYLANFLICSTSASSRNVPGSIYCTGRKGVSYVEAFVYFHGGQINIRVA